ncbi:MAG: SusD/RagB family nutrient-binding outer membrane lipoprotein [Bacteroidales bacterium]|nr:SusD/RagB family nutrient-binding outer membrane lipoprotein [Bacteroidales bacterium]
MKVFKTIIVIALLAFTACDVDYYTNPNEPTTPPSSAVFNHAVDQIMTDTRDVWFSGRFTTVTMQYWQQSEYGDEDRYGYRESMRETWEDFYYNLENLRKVIQLNTDEETAADMQAYGSNNNQIQATRIMMAYTFNIMADTWGDIPYYSYNSDNESFQALQLGDTPEEEQVLSPKYAEQQAIYEDILNELKAAAENLNENEGLFTTGGDNIYDGDVAKWKKFANSLRLRIALKIMGADQNLANQHINDALDKGVFTSNADNAGFTYEANDKNAAPMYTAWNVDNRSDFAIGLSFTQLLKGENVMGHDNTNPVTDNPFSGITDPRIEIYANQNSDGNYVGMPIAESSDEAATIKFESLPGDAIINTPDYTEYLMEYAEVEFILSELNNWDQSHYEAGIEASMERWGVPEAAITDYINEVPDANEENVLTQKYIALYLQPHTAWAEYRRTGYPETLIPPYTDYSVTNPETGDTYNFTFSPIPAEIENTQDLPYRMKYPDQEYTLNGDQIREAINRLPNGDKQSSKLWWDVN